MLIRTLLSLTLIALAATLSAAERSNVLFIAIDDLRSDLGALGAAHAKTPHLDAFANTARIFTHHYVQVPTCGASRCALLSGRYPTRPAHVGNNAIRDTHPDWAADSLPARFRDAGYRTLALGKITHYPGGLTGKDWAEGPEELPGAWDRCWIPDTPWETPRAIMHGYASGVARQPGKSPPLEAFDGPDEAYPDAWIASEAVGTLRELAPQEQPWFFAVGFLKPHLPFSAPKRWHDLHADGIPDLSPTAAAHPDWPSGWHRSGEFRGNYGHADRDPETDPDYARLLRQAYAASTSYMDAQVGRVLDALRDLKLEDNTIVVVWSDHGFLLGEHAIWGKHCLYEHALRSPLMIRHPGLPQPGKPTAAIVEAVDLFPTLTDLCAVDTPADLDGRTLRPQLADPDAPSTKPAHGFWTNGRRTIRTERWRLIQKPADSDGEPQLELFDYQADPDETRNHASENPQVVRELLAGLQQVSLAGEHIAAEPKRPNILFAIADDWGLHAGAYGTPWVKTPAFDRVAREGLLFRNAYTPMAKCAPSRAIVLTGRHLWQNEEAGNHMAYFPAKLKSWPEVLTEHGWHMGITGKGWGPGVANDADGRPRAITGKQFNRHKAQPPARSMSNNDYAANFADFLDAAPDDTPWCFWYGAHEPHRGYEFQAGLHKGGKQLDDIDHVPGYWPDHETVRHDMLDYAFEVEHVDRHLGRMIAELEDRGLLQNTLVIVTSDHGMPFPRDKGYAYHDSNHIPLAVRWPAGIASPARVIDDFVDFTDIAPTILEVAGIDHEDSGMLPITGQSWRPLFESDKHGQVLPERDHVLIGKERTDVGRPHDWGYPIRGIVTRDFLYLHNYEPTRWPAGNPETGYLDTDGSPTKALILDLGRRDRSNKYWQLNFGLRPADELYALPDDPDCVHNRAADPAYAATVKSLREQMEAELKAQGDPRMFGKGHIFDEYKPTNGAGFYEKFIRGEKPRAGWVNETDFEKEPIAPK